MEKWVWMRHNNVDDEDRKLGKYWIEFAPFDRSHKAEKKVIQVWTDDPKKAAEYIIEQVNLGSTLESFENEIVID